jgi:hypothetical protein
MADAPVVATTALRESPISLQTDAVRVSIMNLTASVKRSKAR